MSEKPHYSRHTYDMAKLAGLARFQTLTPGFNVNSKFLSFYRNFVHD